MRRHHIDNMFQAASLKVRLGIGRRTGGEGKQKRPHFSTQPGGQKQGGFPLACAQFHDDWIKCPSPRPRQMKQRSRLALGQLAQKATRQTDPLPAIRIYLLEALPIRIHESAREDGRKEWVVPRSSIIPGRSGYCARAGHRGCPGPAYAGGPKRRCLKPEKGRPLGLPFTKNAFRAGVPRNPAVVFPR